ncbi:hypothetical protein ACIGMX_34560 [Streptomyces aquilus]|uniref:hypothetical protein n=1 Tax=Streptomyces aquilus TaxID=2548456 RepID=UPI0037D618A5
MSEEPRDCDEYPFRTSRGPCGPDCAAAGLDDFLARLDAAQQQAGADRGAYLTWLGHAGPALAKQLTEALPAEARAAGLRLEWEFPGAQGLTARDTEPPVGTHVKTAVGAEWVRYDDGLAGWEPLGGGEHKTWTKVTGNDGPVRVLQWGDPE